MIVLDSSALIAIYNDEPERQDFEVTLARSRASVLPACVYVETVMTLSRHSKSRQWIDATLVDYDIRVAPIDEAVARRAADAFELYGRGRGHRARLNFGDCLVYAVAKSLDAPLLFKGDDFRLTDVTPAL
jgi:ribonuclease VapC